MTHSDVAVSATSYEPFDPRFRDNPTAYFAMLREQAPIYKSPQGYWCVTRHADVRAVMSAPDKFSSKAVGSEGMALGDAHDPNGPLAKLGEGMPVDLAELVKATLIVSVDPPEHTRLRRFANRGFSPARLAQWTSKIQGYTDELVAKIDQSKPWDVVSQLAMPMPVAVICGILGVEDSLRPSIKHWSDVIIVSGQGDNRNTAEGLMPMLHMLRDFSFAFAPLIEARRANPGDDIVSDMVREEDALGLSTVEVLMLILAFMVAGNETSTATIGNTIVTLLQNPDQLDKVQKDPTLITNLVEESLRFVSPIQFAIRTPIVEVEIGGQTMKPGEIVLAILGSANRDPAVFPEPDRFDVTRTNAKAHVSFGYGIHTCVGAYLAREEVKTVLKKIVPELHKWRLSDAPLMRVPSNMAYGYQRIVLEPR